jgi:8-oxo-dGTP pyrophosphatase MutT (NUDIX family)
VLAPLVLRDGALWFVLTERSAHLKRHAGQIAFPGGAPEPGDADLAATALREAKEEVGLEPAAVELLGAFDPYETLTGFAITPFVGLVRGDFTPIPDPAEVADVFEAPFAFLMDPGNRRQAFREAGGVRRAFYETPYGSRYIWGATAGLLKSLSDRLYGGAP